METTNDFFTNENIILVLKDIRKIYPPKTYFYMYFGPDFFMPFLDLDENTVRSVGIKILQNR